VGYTAVRGGEEAIRAAERLERELARGSGLSLEAVERGLKYAVDQVMGEAGLYAPRLAALAVIEAQGDLAEAAFMLRAYRSTLPRAGHTSALDTGKMRLIRRVSSAFKDVPGGQVLGPSRDYSQRLLGRLRDEESPSGASSNGATTGADSAGVPRSEGVLPKVTNLLRKAGLVAEPKPRESGEPFDLTREALRVPARRSGRLQSLARGEPGAMSALAYSSLRGYGVAHSTLAEFRVGSLPLKLEHPYLGEEVEIGEVECTEVEAVGMSITASNSRGEEAGLSLGYGLVFGRNERKAIAMANLDAAIGAGYRRAQGPKGVAEDEEFVLYHADGIEASGFVEHLKLPHYVTFQASLDRLREVREQSGQEEEAKVED